MRDFIINENKIKIIKLRKMKEERNILKRQLNIYYFDNKKRDLIYKRIKIAEIEIIKLEKEIYENNNTN